MKALTLNCTEETWETTKGLVMADVPKPALDERRRPLDAESAIIKVKYAGFCGSDKGIWFRSSFKDLIFKMLNQDGRERLILGHEMLGEIVEAGSHLHTLFGLKVGDTVSAESHVYCGACYQCQIGQNNVCRNERIIGISDSGCFAEYIKLPGKILWKTDTTRIRPEVAAIQEPLGNAVFASSCVDIRGKTIAIFGLGTIGLFTVLVARALGAAKIIGIEPLERNCHLARQLGIDEVIPIDVSKKSKTDWHLDTAIADEIRAHTHGDGVDVTLEMSGRNANINTAVRATRRGGDIVLFGIQGGNFVFEKFEEIIVQGISFHCVIGRAIFKTWYTVRNLLESRTLGIADKIYDVILNKGHETIYPFRSFNPETFERLITTYPKIIFKLD